ncbi:MAG: PAS domain S-box protein [Candidatus Omnitrophica bacterium]|nr:PAS domain S-box protein [Candidatus Omnitrophota bacterium]
MFAYFEKSFSRRLTFSYLAIFFTVFLSMGFFIVRSLKHEALSNLTSSLTSEIRLLDPIVRPMLDENSDPLEMQQKITVLGRDLGTRITIIHDDGVVLADSQRTPDEVRQMDNHRNRPEIRIAFEGGVGTSARYSTTVGEKMLYAAAPLMRDGKVSGVIRAALPLRKVEHVLAAAEKPIQIGLWLGAFLVLVMSFWVARYQTKRIGEITKAAERYAKGDLKKKIFIDAKDEIRILADSMNYMAISLQQRIEEIEAEKTKLAAILENMAEGMIAVDHERHILMINTSVEKMFGISRSEMIGRSLIETIRNPKIDLMMEQAVAGRTIASQEIELLHPEGKVLNANAVGIGSKNKQVAGILVLHDMTKIRKLEKLRTEFVANVSHELKTPLTTLKGFIETLLSGALRDGEKAKSFLTMMETDTDRLTRLIDDLLELSKIESKEIPLNLAPLNIGLEFDRVINRMRPGIEKKQIFCVNQILSGQIPSVMGDRDKLEQVIINLLDNAVKFNRQSGHLMVSAVLLKDRVRVSVQDTGMGIPKEDRERIFERFFRVDKARSRELGGTGLGLSIVKHIIEAHGGAVSCESEVGKGSTFSFTLKVAPV